LCEQCEIRNCALKKGVDVCIECNEYICKKLEEYFENYPDCKNNSFSNFKTPFLLVF